MFILQDKNLQEFQYLYTTIQISEDFLSSASTFWFLQVTSIFEFEILKIFLKKQMSFFNQVQSIFRFFWYMKITIEPHRFTWKSIFEKLRISERNIGTHWFFIMIFKDLSIFVNACTKLCTIEFQYIFRAGVKNNGVKYCCDTLLHFFKYLTKSWNFIFLVFVVNSNYR